MASKNKLISTVLAIAVCALSLAVHAADNEWNVTASTEWSNSDNWSLSLDDTSNELRFRAGSGVLDSDVTVTFADAYEYPNRLKFENISTLDGSGLVTFRGNTDESGICIDCHHIIITSVIRFDSENSWKYKSKDYEKCIKCSAYNHSDEKVLMCRGNIA